MGTDFLFECPLLEPPAWVCCRLSIRVEVPWDTNLLRTLPLPFPPPPLPGPPPGAPLMFSDVDVVRHMVQLG